MLLLTSISGPVVWKPFFEKTEYWRRFAWLWFEVGFAWGDMSDFTVNSFMHCLKMDITEPGDTVTYFKQRALRGIDDE